MSRWTSEPKTAPKKTCSLRGRALWDGKRLRDIRWARGLSQESLAQAAGVARGDVSRHERNDPSSNPSLDVLLRLAVALCVPPAALFEPPGAPVPSALTPHPELPPQVAGNPQIALYVNGLLRHVDQLTGAARSGFVAAMVNLLDSYDRRARSAQETRAAAHGPRQNSAPEEYE